MSGNGEGVVVGKEPIISVRAWRSFSKGNNPVSKSSVSVAWLVMPIHWIRDEHTYYQQNWRSLRRESKGKNELVALDWGVR